MNSRELAPENPGFCRNDSNREKYQDWLAVDAVSCELFSGPHSLLTGKNTGNFAPSARNHSAITSHAAEYFSKKNWSCEPNRNRERSGKEQGMKFPVGRILQRNVSQAFRLTMLKRTCPASALIRSSPFSRPPRAWSGAFHGRAEIRLSRVKPGTHVRSLRQVEPVL